MFKQLSSQLSNFDGNFGFYIKDLFNDRVLFSYNAHEPFPAASVNKIFIAGYVGTLLQQNHLKLTDKIKHTKEDTLGGSGIIKLLETGRTFTFLELLKLMIIESDNIASKMLINHVGPSELNNYIKGFEYIKHSGLKIEQDTFVGWGLTTPLEVGNYFSNLISRDSLLRSIFSSVDSTSGIGYHLQSPYEQNNYCIYSKGGTLYPNVKNVVAYIENKENQKCLVSYFSKDLKGIHVSVDIMRLISSILFNKFFK